LNSVVLEGDEQCRRAEARKRCGNRLGTAWHKTWRYTNNSTSGQEVTQAVPHTSIMPYDPLPLQLHHWKSNNDDVYHNPKEIEAVHRKS